MTVIKRPTIAYSYTRYSRAEQVKGNSLARQLKLSREYAQQNDLVLDETLKDLGVSAFRGKNASEGALGRFLGHVKDGTIAPGSYLLVESLDRISRQHPFVALGQFIEMINAGIVIVTMVDLRRYDKDIDSDELSFSIGVMARAHEESATKGKRVKAAYQAKRDNAHVQKPTKICPGWMTLAPNRSKYILVPERASLVLRIFEMACSGQGRRLIARTFNREGIEPWGQGAKKGDGWSDSYIAKILANRAVIGEFQPHELVEGARVPIGEPIPDYFPSVISKEVYYTARDAVARRVHKGGRVDYSVKNLFAGISYCAHCDGTVTMVDKGQKGGRLLCCNRTLRGMSQCDPHSWKYSTVEDSYVKFIVNYDFSGADENARKTKEAQLCVANASRIELESKVQALVDFISTDKTQWPRVRERMRAIDEEIANTKAMEATLTAELHAAEANLDTTHFAESARNPSHRARLKQEIRKRTTKMVFHFQGNLDHPNMPGGRYYTVKQNDGTSVDVFPPNAYFKWVNGRCYQFVPEGYQHP